MFDTLVTVIGNVATKPNRRELANGAVTDFRIASTSRRYDREKSRWVDGDELFIKVSCWRALGDNVAESINVGDPVMVRGRLYSRRITDDMTTTGKYVYEINAQSVGHDLSRGASQFTRRHNRPSLGNRSNSEFDAIVENMEKDGLAAADATTTAALSRREGTRPSGVIPIKAGREHRHLAQSPHGVLMIRVEPAPRRCALNGGG